MYIATFFLKLGYLIVALLGSGVFRLWRWIGRSVKSARAAGWPRTEATVESSFELDESSKRIRNLLRNLFDDQFDWRPGGMLRPPEMNDVYDDDYGNDASKPWISGIRYSYRVNGTMYSGGYLLPKAHKDGGSATKAGRAWVGKRIVVRYNECKPVDSYFLKIDGAPGLPRIPAGLDTEPYVTTLSLRL